jgi:nicotinamide-nucleotide amidase
MERITELAHQLGESLQAAGELVTTAESCTGGGIAEAITRVAGSSAWFEAGYVTYSNRQKTAMLQVPEELFASHGAVSQQVAAAMARGAQQLSGARFSVAVSGVAGPGGGTPDKPVGMVCFAWASGMRLEVATLQFFGDRATVRRKTVEQALSGLLLLLRGQHPLAGGNNDCE